MNKQAIEGIKAQLEYAVIQLQFSRSYSHQAAHRPADDSRLPKSLDGL